MDSLPNELLSRILGELMTADDATSSYSSLCSTSLVCRRLADISQELLWTRVVITSRQRSQTFWSEGRRLHHRTVALEDTFAAAQSLAVLQDSIKSFTRLVQLTLGSSVAQLPALESPSLQNLKKLHLVLHRPLHQLAPSHFGRLPFSLDALALTSTGGVPPAFLRGLVAASPSLQSLDLSAYTGPRSPSFFLPFLPIASELKTLRLGSTNSSTAPFLLSCTSLATFDCSTLYSIPQLQFPHSLRSLGVEQNFMIEALAIAVRSLPELENVRVTESLMSKRREAGSLFVQECGSRKVKVRMMGDNGQMRDGGAWMSDIPRILAPTSSPRPVSALGA